MKYNNQTQYQLRMLAVALLMMGVLFLVACGATSSQPETETFTVGFVTGTSLQVPTIESFVEAMTELGYVEGENITYVGLKEYLDDPIRYVEDHEPLLVARELVEADVDLIVSTTTPATTAAYEASEGTDIPIVFAAVTDPIKSGLIEDYQRPGGRATGISFGEPENTQDGLRLEWMTKIIPDLKRVQAMYNPDDAVAQASIAAIERVAPELGVEIVHVHVRTDEEANAAWENLPEDIDAIFGIPSLESYQTLSRHPEIMTQLPVATSSKRRLDQGALLAYGADPAANGQAMARLAGQILKGADPAELLVEVPEFFLFINLKASSTFGLEVPEEALRQAYYIIREDDELVKDNN